MVQWNIRRMEEKDLMQVAGIEAASISPPWSEKGFRDAIALQHTIFLVAENEGEIVGYCGCYQSLEEAEITNVAVRTDLRGHGIARKLLERLMEIGKEQGAFAFTLEVRVSNLPAIHLYESLGFESVGIRKNFYDRPKEDAMIMWRRWQA